MPDAPEAAPATPAPEATPAPAAPPAPPERPADWSNTPADEPAWLPERLERAKEAERKALLAELGIEDPQKAKATLEAARKLEDEQRSIADKLTDAAGRLTASEAQAQRYAGIISQWAGAQMGALTEAQQAAVKAIAGDDTAEQLRAISALRPTWAAASNPAPAAPPAAAVPPPQAPEASAPPHTAPPGTSPGSPPNHREVFEGLQKTNPVLAARYAAQHPSVFTDS